MFNRKEYRKQYDKQYRIDNKEKIAEYKRQYRINNLEHIQRYDEERQERRREIYRQRRKEKQEYVNEYKISKGCSVCSYNKCADALEFHHNGDKKFNIAIGVSSRRSLEAIKEEIEKCTILCANCHAELHKNNPPEEY